MKTLLRRALLVAFVAPFAVAGCRGCASCDSDEEEEEERARERDHFWRARIEIVGRGAVKTFIPAFDCASDGGATAGTCGPLLLKFKELAPATMEAIPAPGWVFDHWESLIRERDGAVGPRRGKMPDGHVYLNGFGYEDTGQLETVTAVFVPQG